MMNIELGEDSEPLNTHFVLTLLEGKKDCPRFYGKKADKITVCDALLKDIHVEVKSKWGELRCHCTKIPMIRLSKTSRNLNKVFLTCGMPYMQQLAVNIFSGFRQNCSSIRDLSIN